MSALLPYVPYLVHALVTVAGIVVYHLAYHGDPPAQAQGASSSSPAPAGAPAGAPPGGLAGQYPIGAAILEALARGFEARIREHAAASADKVLPVAPLTRTAQ